MALTLGLVIGFLIGVLATAWIVNGPAPYNDELRD